jgi:hypothetical protein
MEAWKVEGCLGGRRDDVHLRIHTVLPSEGSDVIYICILSKFHGVRMVSEWCQYNGI